MVVKKHLGQYETIWDYRDIAELDNLSREFTWSCVWQDGNRKKKATTIICCYKECEHGVYIFHLPKVFTKGKNEKDMKLR